MVKEYYQNESGKVKKDVENTCDIGLKMLYVFFNNHCLSTKCSKCLFRERQNRCSIEGIPESWLYKIDELRETGYFIKSGYNYHNCSFKYPDKFEILHYIGGLCFLCSTNAYSCGICKYNKDNSQTSVINGKCEVLRIRRFFQNLKIC